MKHKKRRVSANGGDKKVIEKTIKKIWKEEIKDETAYTFEFKVSVMGKEFNTKWKLIFPEPPSIIDVKLWELIEEIYDEETEETELSDTIEPIPLGTLEEICINIGLNPSPHSQSVVRKAFFRLANTEYVEEDERYRLIEFLYFHETPDSIEKNETVYISPSPYLIEDPEFYIKLAVSLFYLREIR